MTFTFPERMDLARRLLRRRKPVQRVPGLSACWEWSGGCDPTGYGRIKFRGVKLYTHRAAVMASTGAELFSDDVVMHACDNPACFNPDHLTVGDHALNLQGAGARGLIVRKLDAKQVAEIRMFLAMGFFPPALLAEWYEVSTNTIHQIRDRVTWRDVPAAKEVCV